MDIEKIEPREIDGSRTQSRFHYQKEFIAFKCLEMLENSEISKVYCDFHDDCVVRYKDDFYNFFQVRGLTGALTLSKLKQIIPNMYYNFQMVDGKCKCALVTNTIISSDVTNIERIKEHINGGIANEQEKKEFEDIENDFRELIGFDASFFNTFMLNYRIMNIPSFSEFEDHNEFTLEMYNINKLSTILNNSFDTKFLLADVEALYGIIFKLVDRRSKLTTRSRRYITREDILDSLEVPESQRIYFSNDYSKEEIENLRGQTILHGKLRDGEFDELFISRAKLIRYATKYERDKLSKFQSIRKTIDDFEYRLRNICVDIFEKYNRFEHFDSLDMLYDLQDELIKLAKEEKYQKLDLNKDFIKGLVFEATSKCIMRWSK